MSEVVDEEGGGRRGGRGGGKGGGPGPRTKAVISDEIRAMIIDQVLVHGMTVREAGQRVQPNLSRLSVASIVRTFGEANRKHSYDFWPQKVTIQQTYSVGCLSKSLHPNSRKGTGEKKKKKKIFLPILCCICIARYYGKPANTELQHVRLTK